MKIKNKLKKLIMNIKFIHFYWSHFDLVNPKYTDL